MDVLLLTSQSHATHDMKNRLRCSHIGTFIMNLVGITTISKCKYKYY